MSARPEQQHAREYNWGVWICVISQINGLCLAQFVVCGARVASPPRVSVEFELVRALANELRRAGEGPSFGGGMKGTIT